MGSGKHAAKFKLSEQRFLLDGFDFYALLGAELVEGFFDQLNILPGQVFWAARFSGGVSQQVGRVEHGEYLDALPFEKPAPYLGDREFFAGKELERCCAQRNNDLGLDELYLLEEPERGTGFGLERLWNSVPGRAALDNVGDVNARAGNSCGLEDFVQQLSAASYKRPSLQIFVLAGALAHYHQLGIGIAFAENHVGAAFGKATGYACSGLGS